MQATAFRIPGCAPASARPRDRRRGTGGFTIIELVVTVAVVAIVLAMGVPALSGTLERNRLRDAAESVASSVRFARSESIKRGLGGDITVSVTTDGATAWCLGLRQAGACDCTLTDPAAANACALTTAGAAQLKVTTAGDFSGVSLTAVDFGGGTTSTFEPVRGTATAGTVTLQSATGTQVRVQMSALGWVQLCTPTGGVGLPEYPECS
jgi:type IV fimbrial biogenesis protein FimT